MENYNFLIAAGGTGGHLFPAISVVEELQKINPNNNFFFVGRKDKIEFTTVNKLGFKFFPIEIDGIHNIFSLKNLLLPFKILKSQLLVRNIISKFKIDALIATGAYISYPPAIAASQKKVPVYLMESNFNPGKSISILSKHSEILFTSFPETHTFLANKPIKKIIYSGNPVRTAFLNNVPNQSEARKKLGLETDKPTLLVFGGSLGARAINNAVLENLPEFLANNIQIIWQTGKNSDICSQIKFPESVKCTEFIDDMPTAYSAADLVISRSGASSLSEIAVMGKPSILIPLVIASNNEQEYNAKYFEKKGAAVIFNQNSLEVAFAQRVLDLLFNTNKLIDMQMQAKFFAKPNAANFIANTILENLSSRK